ncbi:DUF1569 domain-containing protein [uncultured Shewanella sp.]|uniref:DUF1569 domain-containing protein n=1 Tax=uncultured Shewanella sp. TaxID=173975 RepID=UPI0026320050|nr:DUF1569 domain-containing protein [uncultured Shewanella sp.]
MKRRIFLKSMLAGGAITSVAVGVAWMVIDAESEALTIESTLVKLEKLKQVLQHEQQAIAIKTTGVWDLKQIFTHCAQSVEYSMTGYPKHKSKVFKQTIGSLAFSAFASKGKMTHKLSEAIPGAPRLLTNKTQDTVEVLIQLDRFKQSLLDFESYIGELKPHFAYGLLTKEEYALAHAMHFNNHLLEITT